MSKKKEPSNRQLRVNELLRRNFSDIVSEIDLYHTDKKNISITVTQVKTSSDLKIAYVFVLPLGGYNEKEVIENLTNFKGYIKKKLSKKINLKFMPEIKFISDDTYDKIQRTNQIFDKIKRDKFESKK